MSDVSETEEVDSGPRDRDVCPRCVGAGTFKYKRIYGRAIRVTETTCRLCDGTGTLVRSREGG